MFIKKSCAIIAFCSITFFTNYSMEEQTKENIEQQNALYLTAYGDGDAPSTIQTINNKIMATYKARGYLKQETNILVKYMNNAATTKIHNNGGTTWNNMFTNERNLIHITREHDALTNEELQAKLAHEQAHIAVQQNTAINPHYLMGNIHFYGLAMGCLALSPCWFTTSIALAAKSNRPLMTFLGINAIIAGGIRANSYCDRHMIERFDLPITSPSRIEYPFLHKLVEAECDIIAATVFKDGGKNGESVYRKHLIHNGNTNGIDGDHPYTTTRIWYHSKIKEWQDYFEKNKENPEMK